MAEGKILLLLVIALLVLGPEKLPRLAADIGRWVGRARSMARQLQAQLDQEVNLSAALREPERVFTAAAQAPSPAAPAAATVNPDSTNACMANADPAFSHAHGDQELHPDYAAGQAAALAAVAGTLHAEPTTGVTSPSPAGNATHG